MLTSIAMNPNARCLAPRGFSLVEFMIAITVSLVILAALTSTFVANSRTRTELERSNQQLENGRYALAVLSEDLDLAGYLGGLDVFLATLTNPATKSGPCRTTIQQLLAALPLHIQGYDNVPDADASGAADVNLIDEDADGTPDLGCLPTADVRPNTDILVVRHVSTCLRGATNCPDIAGAAYFQASQCDTEVADISTNNTPFLNSRMSYRLDTVIANLNRTQRDCTTLAQIRRYLVHIYFVANNDRAGDGIPTLKRAELTAVGGAAGFQTVSLANGIENFQVEYGLDCSFAAAPPDPSCNLTGAALVNAFAAGALGDGSPELMTASPGRYDRANHTVPLANCAANANCMQNWLDVTSVKVSVLARNLEPSRDYVDSKIYLLGLKANRNGQCALDANNDGTCEAFNDRYRRHVYQSSMRLMNPAGWREQ